MDNNVFLETLPNGIQVVGETMPSYSSISLAVYIRAGSVYETDSERGISHFIEHMLFKGTQRRTAAQIAAQIDAVGGNINAYTAKECTCFYVKLLSDYLEVGADILSDILYNSKFDVDDMAREKDVVCEEILMVDDTPDDVVYEKLNEIYYAGSALSYPILGTANSVGAITREDIKAYMDKMYVPENIVISCAGNFDKTQLLNILSDKFNDQHHGVQQPYPPCATIDHRAFTSLKKKVAQAQLCIALPAPAIDEPLQYPLLVFNNVLGGTSSSRLFQSVREQRGLAYSVYSYVSSYYNTGIFSLYAGTSEANVATVCKLMLDELYTMKENGITDDEFLRSKSQLKGSYLLSLESTSSHSAILGKSMLLRNKLYSVDEAKQRLNAVTPDDVLHAAQFALDFDRMGGVLVAKLNKCSKEDVIRNMILESR